MISILQDPWTAEQIDTIRAEWAAGTSAAQIGRLVGRSKNSVTGKAHRMGLPARPGPIVRRAGQQEVVEAAKPKITDTRGRGEIGTVSDPEFGSKSATRPPPVSPARSCEWIDGERGAYVKCGAPISRGSYCAEHAAVCYVGQKAVENAA